MKIMKMKFRFLDLLEQEVHTLEDYCQDVFNYGMDGSNFCSILFLLDKELDKNKESDVIINFDLDGLFFSKEPPFKVIPIYKAKYLIEKIFFIMYLLLDFLEVIFITLSLFKNKLAFYTII